MTTTPRTNLGGHFGFVKEDTWSVYKAPTKFLPTLGDPGITGGPEPENSEGNISGRLHLDADQFDTGNETYKGEVGMELYDHASAALFEACLGSLSTGSVSGGLYPHTFTPGEPLPSYTTQWGIPSASTGVIYPRTLTGCKVESWELAGEVGKICTLGTSWSARNEILVRTVTDGVTTDTDTEVTSATAVFHPDDVGKPISGTGIPSGATIATYNSATSVELSAAATATGSSITFTIGVAAASVSYPSDIIPVRFKNGALSLFGSAVSVKSFTIAGDNNLTYDERRFAGSTRIGREQVSKGLREYTGDVLLEFDDFTQYNRFKRGTQGALSLVLTVGSNSLTITQNIVYTGETPGADGTGIVDQALPFMALGATDAAAITILANNADATP